MKTQIHFAMEEELMIIGRLPYRSDLLRELNKFVAAQGIQAGVIQIMGSLGCARLSFYDQQMHAYRELDLDAQHEIITGTGNISLRAGATSVHLHLGVADSQGRVFGGHCLEGCRVFAVEFTIWPFTGTPPRRVPDTDTGLLLWEQGFYSDEKDSANERPGLDTDE
jgi:predicted DNA-binding protein with PD1-like motif